MNKTAVEWLGTSEVYHLYSFLSFVYVMKFMGDYMAKGKTEIDVVHYLLTAAQQYDPLRDEIYCQLIKQTTNNKSERAEVRDENDIECL